MSVRTNSRYEEQEAEGEVELTLVALTYTGTRSMYRTPAMENQGGYPALDGFQRGGTKLVLLPDNSLSWWETHENFEVSYDEPAVAEALLDANYLPEQVVGPGYDQGVRDRVLGLLGIDGFTNEEDLRRQLREVAGREEAEEDEETVLSDRAEALASSVDRSVLIKVAGSYGEEFDSWLEENTDAEQVTHAKSVDLATFLAGRDRSEVNRRIDTAEAGGAV